VRKPIVLLVCVVLAFVAVSYLVISSVAPSFVWQSSQQRGGNNENHAAQTQYNSSRSANPQYRTGFNRNPGVELQADGRRKTQSCNDLPHSVITATSNSGKLSGDGSVPAIEDFDLAEPNPRVIGQYNLVDCDIVDFSVTKNYVYLACGSFSTPNGLKIIDVSDRKSPRLTGSCEITEFVYYIFVTESYAYVVSRENGIVYVVDISSATTPKIVSKYVTTEKFVQDIYVKGVYAYIAHYDGIEIVDVSDKKNLRYVSNHNTANNHKCLKILLKGSYVYAMVESSGGVGNIEVIDVSVQSQPSRVAFYKYYATDFFVTDSWLFIIKPNTLNIIDIKNPLKPKQEGQCEMPGECYGIHVSGNYAYVACEKHAVGSFVMVDISNKKAPKIAASCKFKKHVYQERLFVKPPYAYIITSTSNGVSGLKVIQLFNRK
jgi:hypothetical protein